MGHGFRKLKSPSQCRHSDYVYCIVVYTEVYIIHIHTRRQIDRQIDRWRERERERYIYIERSIWI